MSKQPVYWKQKNGELISIDDMDINHLRNVLKMILTTKFKRVYSGIEVRAESIDIDHYEFESDLGVRFNDDESRGNQW